MINFHDITPEDKIVVFLKKEPEALIALWVLQQKLGGQIEKIIDAEKLKEKAPLPEFEKKIVFSIGTVFDLETMRHIAARTKFVLFSNDYTDRGLYSGFGWAFIRTGRTLAKVIWEYCHGDFSASWILDYTEDLSNWKWKAHNPLHIQTVFHSEKISKEFLDRISTKNPESVEEEGRAILEKKEKENVEQSKTTKPRRVAEPKKEPGADHRTPKRD